MKKLLLLAALACSTFAVGGALHAQDAEAPAEQAQTQAANREDTPEYKAFADEMVAPTHTLLINILLFL